MKRLLFLTLFTLASLAAGTATAALVYDYVPATTPVQVELRPYTPPVRVEDRSDQMFSVAQRGGEIVSDTIEQVLPTQPGEDRPVQICVDNRYGLPLSIYSVPGDKLGVIDPGYNCIEVDDAEAERVRGIRIRATAGTSITFYPNASLVSAPKWYLRIGPFPNSWRWDVGSWSPVGRW